MKSDKANSGKKHHQTKFFISSPILERVYTALEYKSFFAVLSHYWLYIDSSLSPSLFLYISLSSQLSLPHTYKYTDYGPMKKHITQYSSFSNGNGSRLIFYVFCISICTKVCMKEQLTHQVSENITNNTLSKYI